MKNGIIFNDGKDRLWLCCPVCSKKQFPLGGSVIKNLEITCKRCKSLFVANFNTKSVDPQ